MTHNSLQPIAAALLLAASPFVVNPAGAQDAEGPEVNWSASTWGSPRAFTEGAEAWAEEIRQRTDGKFNIELHYGGELSAPNNNLDNIQLGAFEVANFCAGFHPGKHPAAMVLDLPYLPFADYEVQRAVHEAVYDHPYIQDELAQWNAKWMLSSTLPQMELMGTDEPPQTLDDLEGERVRAIGPLGDAYEALGAVPVSLPAPEAYQALSRGVLDAVAIALYAMESYRLHEPADWFTSELSPGTVNCPWVVNIDAWNDLPDNYKQIALDARDAAYEAYKEAYSEASEEAIETFEEAGLEHVQFTDEERAEFREKAARPVWDAWIEEAKADGIPAEELFDLVMSSAEKAQQ